MCEFGTDKGREGAQNPKNLEDVISYVHAPKQKLWRFNAPQEGMSFTYMYDHKECSDKHSPDYCSGWAYVVAANVSQGTKCLKKTCITRIMF